MRKSVLLIFALFVGVGLAAPQSEPDSSAPEDKEIERKDQDDSKAYSYNWGVNDAESKNYYGQEQTSDDTGRVEGKYFVWLADGRLMTVSYYVDGKSGFVPKITFSDPNFNPPPADAPPQPI